MEHFKFEMTLEVGTKVEARWTNSFSYYAEAAEVVRVNRSSVRVRVLTGYLAGRETTLPRMLGAKWSSNNGVFPWCEEEWAARKAKYEAVAAKISAFMASRPTATGGA